ncbi:MAG: hypothetical protein Q8L86_20935 [Vicinamibacterales bacterium]|nr:hypothetical protein [Vicinamibacterales bacterium]
MRLIFSALVVALVATAPYAAAQPATFGRVSVHPATLLCTDIPVYVAPTVSLRVIGVEDTQPRAAFAPGDSVVLSTGLAGGVAPGQRYLIRRVSRGISRQPISRASPGAVRTAGWLTVTAADDATALARIDGACDAVLPDDYLEPYVLPVLPRADGAAGTPQHDRMARVVFGVDETRAFGTGALLTIDRGSDDGVAQGRQFVVYRDTGTGRPLVVVGEAVALAVGPDVSTVVLTRARYEVLAGDYLAMRTP